LHAIIAHEAAALGGINLTQIIYLPDWELVALAVLSLYGAMHGSLREGAINPFIPPLVRPWKRRPWFIHGVKCQNAVVGSLRVAQP